MHQPSQELVPFRGQQILTFSDNGDHFIAVKPLCDNFRIDWSSQFKKLNSDQIFSSVIAMIATTGTDGKRYEMICLPLEVFPMWLARIDTRRVKNPQAKELILMYQKEATKVLYQHFLARTVPEYVEGHTFQQRGDTPLTPLERGIQGDFITVETSEYIGLLKDKISALEGTPKKPRKAPLPLSEEEKKEIKRLISTGKYTYTKIAKMMNRSSAIVSYLGRGLMS